MTAKTVHPADEMECESCREHFHYDRQRHCWKCDALTCPHCSSIENLCPECRSRVLPDSIEPMLARTGSLPAASDTWACEFKWDGVRTIAFCSGRRLNLQSRNLIDVTFRYPELKGMEKTIPDNTILDGEIIALDNQNRPSFSILQKRMRISPSAALRLRPGRMRIYYYLFDILYLDGVSRINEPYHRRREQLESLNIDHPFCRIPPAYRGDPRDMLSVVRQFHLEGLICKKVNSRYTPGKRSDDWIKVKIVQSREFIIGGFKYAHDSTNRIGSLQMGAYDDDMNLHYVGSTGTDFAARDHEDLRALLEPVQIEHSPFAEESDLNVRFVRPVYIAQVEYRRWPENGLIQQSSYKGLRMDKYPAQIKIREE